MEFESARDAARDWGVTIRVVQAHCRDGRVPGAKKYGNVWMLPAGAPKPADPRRAKKPGAGQPVWLAVSSPWPRHDPDAVLNAYGEPLRTMAAANLALYRGDPAPIKAYWRGLKPGDMTMPTAALTVCAAAVGSGDAEMYYEMTGALHRLAAGMKSERDKALLSLPEVLALVNMALPRMTPEWLRAGDFSLFPKECRPFLLYLYAVYQRNVGEHAAARATAMAALTLCEDEESFTWLDIHFWLIGAASGYFLGDLEQARRWLENALRLGAPHGFILPYADYYTGCGDMMEELLRRDYPSLLKPVAELWGKTYANWAALHNALARDSITTALTAQEYYVALLFARGMTYRQAAEVLHLSPSRIKGILSSVYAKLGVSGRSEMKKHIHIY